MFTGTRYVENADGLHYHQQEYVKEKLEEVPLTKADWKLREESTDLAKVCEFRAGLGKCAWTTHNWRYEFLSETSRLQGCLSDLQTMDLFSLNKLIRTLRQTGKPNFMPRLAEAGQVFVQVIVDGGGGDQHINPQKKGQTGICIGIGVQGSDLLDIVHVRSSKARRVTHDSFDVETVSAVDGVDAGLCVAGMVEEFYSGPLPDLKSRIMHRLSQEPGVPRAHVPCILDTDCNSLVVNVNAPKVVRKLSKRRAIDVSDLRECVRLGELQVRAIEGVTNPMDACTKALSKTVRTRGILVELLSTGVYTPVLQR